MGLSDWGGLDAGGYGEKTYLKDVVKLVDRKELKKFTNFRATGPITQYRSYWIGIYKDGKPLPGKKGKGLQIPFVVTNFNSEKQTYDESKPCPFAELAEKMNKYLGDKEQAFETVTVLSNMINRKAQENLPGKIKPPSSNEEKTGFRDIDSKHINPVEVMTFSSNEYRKIKGTIELNEVNLKSGTVTKGPNDPKFGYDIQFKYVEEEKVASDKLKINKGERTKLTGEETEYLIWDLDAAIATQVMTQKDAKKEADRLWREFEKYLKASGKLKGKKDEDEEEDDEDGPEDLDDEDEKPAKGKKKSSKKKDDDEEEDEDEEEEKPKKSKKKKRDDDDEEEDDEPVKSKKSSKKKKDDDEEEEEEEDEEDEKPKKSVKKKPKKRDDDEDEEEEKPKKGKSKKSSKKKDDDEEEEDEDEDDLELDNDD